MLTTGPLNKAATVFGQEGSFAEPLFDHSVGAKQ